MPRKGCKLSEEHKEHLKNTNRGNKYHKGKSHSEETKQRISEANRGKTPWNKNKCLSEEIRQKLSKAHKGIRLSEETKQKMSEAHKARGLHNLNLQGRKRPEFSKQWRQNIGIAHRGMRLSEKARMKISRALKGKYVGEKSSNWRGGKSYEIYPIDWTKTLRRAIRERDKYTCQCCGALQSDRAFDVHHIDGDKKNCDPAKLITLCRKCHGKKTQERREQWKLHSRLPNK